MPESLNQSNTKQSSSSWSFPTSNNFNHNPLEPVQSWTSTANALAELYKSFRELASPPSKANRSVILHRALKHYNYLSRLQSMYDTVLVSRRHTRNLFLLQSREEKTRENLDQLLKITVDLIRLNERDRQKRRSKQSKLGSMSSSGAESSATMVSNNSGQHPHVNSPTDKYHGLRLSEYTVLMNWIGSVNNTQLSSPASQMRLTAKSPFSQSSMALTDLTHHYRHPIASSGPVDQVWAIWQDFLLTGMKPDIVLYTMVIDVLLKARDYNRADQVWNHMQCQGLDHPFENNERKNALGVRSGTAELGSIKSMHGISLHDNITRATKLPFSLLSSIKKHSSLLSMNSDATLTITPNLQTLSVLIQPLVQQSNIKGVERLHKTVIPNDQQQQRPINTVLVNQILQTLIDLGETTAAREIYAEMRNNSDCSQTEPLNMGDSSNTKRLKDTQSSPSNEGPGLLSNPIHHQTSSRRKTWKRQAQKQFLLSNSAYRPQAPLSPSTGLSIRPNETTYKLMLRVARNEKDLELEDQILKEMQCLSLSPSMLDY
ncbi:hypothetical protein FBU30_010699 [Linnemannia zychae]|nr:hypothetical protein FBU30_010699 [Linnemannia zychae]